MNDLDAALLCYSSYFLPGYFDTVFQGDTDDEIWCGIKHFSRSECVITFRGSDSLTDWIRDFQANMLTDPDLGDVESGFFIGVRDLFPKIQKEIAGTTHISIVGHSLGAARALQVAGLFVISGLMPEVITFGSPRPGGAKLKEVLSKISIRSYRNAFDPITNVPLTLSHDPYVHPSDLISIDAQPIACDPLLEFRDHHIQYYVNAMALRLGGYHG